MNVRKKQCCTPKNCGQITQQFYRRIETRLVQISRLLGNIDINIFVECSNRSCTFDSPLTIPRQTPSQRRDRINKLIRETRILIVTLLQFIGFNAVRINCTRDISSERFRCMFTLYPNFHPHI